MLLADYIHDVAFPNLPKPMIALAQIARFEFGESYTVCLYSGVSFSIPDLDIIIDIMVSEFERSGAWAETSFSGPDFRFKKVVPRMLLVTAAPDKTDIVGKPIREVAEQVRQAVTYYNLAGEWTTFSKDNL